MVARRLDGVLLGRQLGEDVRGEVRQEEDLEEHHSGCSTSRAACSSATRSAASLAPACASMMAHSCSGERPATRAPMRWEAMEGGVPISFS